jgi:hypothetical protein
LNVYENRYPIERLGIPELRASTRFSVELD